MLFLDFLVLSVVFSASLNNLESFGVGGSHTKIGWLFLIPPQPLSWLTLLPISLLYSGSPIPWTKKISGDLKLVRSKQ